MGSQARIGRCLNVGHCRVADNRGRITIIRGMPFECPDCSRGLVDVVPFAKRQAAAANADRPALPTWVVPLTLFLVTIGGGSLALNVMGPMGGTQATETEADPDGGHSETLFRLASAPAADTRLASELSTAYLRLQGCSTVKHGNDDKGDIRLHCLANGARIAVTVATAGAPDPAAQLADGDADMALAARPADGDREMAANAHVIGFDTIAIIVNPSNPLARLSQDQLAAILTGGVRDFAQVGGAAGPIRVVAPAAATRTGGALAALVLGDKPLAPGARRLRDAAKVAAAVAADRGAIGVVDLASLGRSHAVAIGAGTAAQLPTQVAVASGGYPLARRLYLYKPDGATKADVPAFVDFVASPDGQQIVAASGLTPFTASGARGAALAGATVGAIAGS
jgi:phosphate transport system substrate-binding protein